MSRSESSAASLAVGAALAAVAFGASGGAELRSATIAEMLVVLAAGGLIAFAVMRARGGRLDGGLTFAAFALLAALTAVSVVWSIVPELSWLEASRTLAYLAAFGAAIACGRLAPSGHTVLLRGLLIAAFAVVAYALASRVWPASLATGEIYARLGQPYGYWNALGATAALAVPPALWLGTRRAGKPAVNALAFPLLSLLVVTLFLSYSRGAMICAAIGALAWVALVPLRLRSITLLAVSLAGAAPVVIWALSKDAFTRNQVPLAVRESVSTQFGLFLLATAVVMLGAGLAIGFRFGWRPPSPRLRLRVGVAAALVACAVPIGLFAVLASSDRGITGTIRADYESFTSTTSNTPGGPSRLLTASSSRGRYWHQAMQIYDANRLHGSGAGTFGVARLRYRNDQLVSRHAHGYIQQTLADLGLAGLVATLLLAISWAVASSRAVAIPYRRRWGLRFGADRVGLVALVLSAAVYGLHSAVDWIWFVPGPTVLALVAAGYVVGRGPLRVRTPASAARVPALAVPAPAVAAAVPVGAGGMHGTALAERPVYSPPPPPPPPPDAADTSVIPTLRERFSARFRVPPLPAWVRSHMRPLLAAGTVVAALICAWAIYQPLRSDDASNNALALSGSRHYDAALRSAQDAHDENPLSSKPLVVRAAVEDARGDHQAALRSLQQAVIDYRGDPQTWLALADYQLNTLAQPAQAIQTVRGALFLDPQSREAQNVFFEANARLNPAPGAAPLPAPAPTKPSIAAPVPASPGN